MPPSACSKRPLAPLVGPGEDALLVAEELALEERLGERRAVERDERLPARAGSCAWIAARELALARAALARDQHGRRATPRPGARRDRRSASPGSCR